MAAGQWHPIQIGQPTQHAFGGRDDCLPDPPVFRNPFAWDGLSPQVVAAATPTAQLDPQAMADCLRQLPKDSVKAESASDQRLMDPWGSSKTGR